MPYCNLLRFLTKSDSVPAFVQKECEFHELCKMRRKEKISKKRHQELPNSFIIQKVSKGSPPVYLGETPSSGLGSLQYE